MRDTTAARKTPAQEAEDWLDVIRRYDAAGKAGDMQAAADALDAVWVRLDVRSDWEPWPMSAARRPPPHEYRIAHVDLPSRGWDVRISGQLCEYGEPMTALLEYRSDAGWRLAPSFDGPTCMSVLRYAQALFSLDDCSPA